MSSLIHIAIDRNHLAMCGKCCSCDNPQPIFEDKDAGVLVTCPKCIELSSLSGQELIEKIKSGTL